MGCKACAASHVSRRHRVRGVACTCYLGKLLSQGANPPLAQVAGRAEEPLAAASGAADEQHS